MTTDPALPATRAEAIIDSSDDAILSKDRDGIITSWNPGAERLYLYREEEAVGRPIAILIPPDRAGEETRILSRILDGEYVEHYETERLRKDGRIVDCLALGLARPRRGGRDHGRRRHRPRYHRASAGRATAPRACSDYRRRSRRRSRPSAAAETLIGEAVPALGADAATLGMLDEIR